MPQAETDPVVNPYRLIRRPRAALSFSGGARREAGEFMESHCFSATPAEFRVPHTAWRATLKLFWVLLLLRQTFVFVSERMSPSLRTAFFILTIQLSKSETISPSGKRITVQPRRLRKLFFALSFSRWRRLEWAFLLSHSIAIDPCLQNTAKSRQYRFLLLKT